MRNNTRSQFSFIKQVMVAGAAMLAMGGALHGMSGSAQATPSGLSFYPSTDIYSRGNFHFDADTFFGTSFKKNTANSIGLEYGVGPDRDGAFGRTELGFDVALSPAEASGGKRFLLNAKTQLYNNEANATRVVAGFFGLGNRQISAPNVGYLLASKAFGFGRVHVGVARAFARESIVGEDRTFFQLSYDRALSRKFIFAVDLYTGKSAISSFSPGLIYNINDKAGIEVSYVRFNNKDISPRNQIYIGFDYNFGGPPAAAPAQPAGGEGAPQGTGGAGGGAGGGGGGGGGGG